MNHSHSLRAPLDLLYRIAIKSRRLLPKQSCQTFWSTQSKDQTRIESIYVINLDRQTDRWREIERELKHVLDASGTDLTKLTIRFSAVDAKSEAKLPPNGDEVVPFYTLGDQLFVEPQPEALPDVLELNRHIQMSRPEVAIAMSHIRVWREIAGGEHEYALVLEDDVWFRPGFAHHLDRAWHEIEADNASAHQFDILYLSYKEVRYGAQKTFLSRNVFRPVRGLWYLSGYVLSRRGASKLLRLLPCRGPVDLWINHQFEALDVRATRQSIIAQRRNGGSSNSYSILPSLTKIGVINSEGASLFQIRPPKWPVFAFGPEGSGLSSLAMALSMLGYRCCSDLEDIPHAEFEKLFSGSADRVFDAYVNIGTLTKRCRELRQHYPQAKVIITAKETDVIDEIHLDGFNDSNDPDIAILRSNEVNRWQVICEHLRCAPPVCSFPEIADLGQRLVFGVNPDSKSGDTGKALKRDRSPWVVDAGPSWRGIHSAPANGVQPTIGPCVSINDNFEALDKRRWLLRDDTFAGNLALFRPANVEFRANGGAALSVRKEDLGVRDFSAASISSRDRYLFGRFEATIQAANTPGMVTGFFLHRDSPRQEIDIEITGNKPDYLLVNVFYNPGSAGARFDYGYRGAPSWVKLGFDASQSAHKFAIEWDPCEIRWFVDRQLVHRRVNWAPTPIPHLPMTVHVNAWPSRSKELAGRLNSRLLPATTIVRSIEIDANIVANDEIPRPSVISTQCI